jgi:hypothetical protein
LKAPSGLPPDFFERELAEDAAIDRSLSLQQRLIDKMNGHGPALAEITRLVAAESALCSFSSNFHDDDDVASFVGVQSRLVSNFEVAKAALREQLGATPFDAAPRQWYLEEIRRPRESGPPSDQDVDRRARQVVADTHELFGRQLEKPPPPLEIEASATGQPAPTEGMAPSSPQRPEPLIKWTHDQPRSRPAASTLPASSRDARAGSVSAEEATSWLAPRREGLRWSLEQLGRVNEVLRQPNSDVPTACSAAQRVSDYLSGPIGLRFSPAREGMEALEWIKKGTAICAPDSTVGAIIKFAEARAALGKLLAR